VLIFYARELLFKANGLTDQEKKLIEGVLKRISAELLDGRRAIRVLLVEVN